MSFFNKNKSMTIRRKKVAFSKYNENETDINKYANNPDVLGAVLSGESCSLEEVDVINLDEYEAQYKARYHAFMNEINLSEEESSQ